MATGIETIIGLEIQGFQPADVREVVANETARLSLEFPYKGLKVYQVDTDTYYKYKGPETAGGVSTPHPSTDWEIYSSGGQTLSLATLAQLNSSASGPIYINPARLREYLSQLDVSGHIGFNNSTVGLAGSPATIFAAIKALADVVNGISPTGLTSKQETDAFQVPSLSAVTRTYSFSGAEQGVSTFSASADTQSGDPLLITGISKTDDFVTIAFFNPHPSNSVDVDGAINITKVS